MRVEIYYFCEFQGNVINLIDVYLSFFRSLSFLFRYPFERFPLNAPTFSNIFSIFYFPSGFSY